MQKPSLSIAAVVMTGIVELGLTSVAHPTPMLVWNASASMPIGLYRLAPVLSMRGDLVLVRPPKIAETLADSRGYLPAGVPLVKRIAAVGGDEICVVDGVVLVNGHAVVRQLAADRAGRPLPQWSGCQVLGGDEIFLLADAKDSFDSRYFGPVPTANIIETLVPLWLE